MTPVKTSLLEQRGFFTRPIPDQAVLQSAFVGTPDPELVGCFRHEGEGCPRCDGAALATGLVFFALAAGILFYGLAVDRTHWAIDKVLGLLPQKLGKFISRQLKSFLQGIRGISTVGGCLEVAAFTALIWALEQRLAVGGPSAGGTHAGQLSAVHPGF